MPEFLAGLFGNHTFTLIAAVIAAIPGMMALAIQIGNRYGAYVKISVECRQIDGEKLLRVRTGVQNASDAVKKIATAFLIVSPLREGRRPGEGNRKEGLVFTEDILIVMQQIVDRSHSRRTLTFTNDFVDWMIEQGCYCEQRLANVILIPLPFYHDENYRIGDEDLTYTSLVDLSALEADRLYSVRFLIGTTGNRLHRTVHDAFRYRPVD